MNDELELMPLEGRVNAALIGYDTPFDVKQFKRVVALVHQEKKKAARAALEGVKERQDVRRRASGGGNN